MGKNKGKLIKDLDKDFIQWLIDTDLYKTEKGIRDKVLKFHRDYIISIKKGKVGGKRKKTMKKRNLKKHIFHYFSTEWCGYCQEFNKTWNQIIKDKGIKKKIDLKKTVINDNNEHLLHAYNIESFPTLLLIKKNGERIKYPHDSRTKKELQEFIQDNL